MDEFTTSGLWSLPVAGLALLCATWVAIRSHVWLPRASPAAARLRRLVRIHLLEPWLTLAWMFLLSTIDWLGSFFNNGTFGAFFMTLPMLILFSAWRPYPATGIQAPALLWCLRIYGPLRWILTLNMWAAFAYASSSPAPNTGFASGLNFAIVGTFVLWLNIVQIRLILAGVSLSSAKG